MIQIFKIHPFFCLFVQQSHNRGSHLGRNPAIEIDHAGLLRCLIARIVVAAVLPAIWWTWPWLGRCILHMQGLLDIISIHPLSGEEIQGFGNRPIQGRGIGEQIQFIDVSFLPALRQTTGGGGQELPVRHLTFVIQDLSCCAYKLYKQLNSTIQKAFQTIQNASSYSSYS